jgi:hypothetical protein
MGKDFCSSQVGKESPPRKEEKVTTDSHLQGSELSHNQNKENFKAYGIIKLSNEEFERDMVEI